MEPTGERLQKALAAAGISSRRHAEELIVAGRVAVNGVVVSQLGSKVGPDDRIAVDGKPVDRAPRHSYVLLHKPKGYLSTAQDERGRPTVLDLVKCDQRVYPVGRLDLESEGVVLLTNDGELTFRLLHPKHELEREYEVWVTPPATDEQLAQLRAGIEIEGWRTSPAKTLRKAGGSVSVIIHEGHKRQIRLMCVAVGLRVTRLVRIRLGPLTLGTLKPGEWRELRPAELDAVRSAAFGTAPAQVRVPPARPGPPTAKISPNRPRAG